MTESTAQHTAETLACLVIDDPLLRPRYGCLDYEQLLEEMKVHNFFTEIAFIPWNYKRSDPKTVRLFAENPDYYAVCVHGCNHSSNEFGGLDYHELSALSSAALWRMEQHKRLTGLPYDPVIVFPQGRFSSVAMLALKNQGYFAAFNSTLRATDGDDLLAIEFQLPATTIYHDFPLFLRRYPEDRAHFVEDVMSGRPIIIVAHHGTFINGYKKITELIDWANGLGNIRWTSLMNIAVHYMGIKAPAGEAIIPTPMDVCPNVKIVLRRYLSEIRDNYIETQRLLTKLYKIMRG